MARIRPISNPNNPIPNNPFYSPESNYINGVSGPFIIGSGLSINNITGVISASGGGGGGAVSSIIAAAGIGVSPAGGTGNVTVSNTGVLSLTAGSGISLSASTGSITISSTSAASVSNVIGTAPISVASGTTTPIISIATASTTNSGATTLVDNLITNDSTKALTAAQGKILQDQLNTLALAGTIELAGTIDAATGLVASVTSVGSADGYAVGSPLPIPSSVTNNTYVIVTTPGTLTPPGGTPTPATRGDWFLVSEVTPGNFQWTFLNVGFDAPPASDTVAGIVELATNLETQAGTDTTRAVTPAGAASTYLPLSTLTAKGTLIAGQAANSPVALPVGTIGQVLQVDPTTTSGLKWVTPAAGCTGTVTQVGNGAGLTGGPITTVGALDLVVQGISAGTYSNPVLTVNCYGVVTGISTGSAGIPCACILAKGDILAGTAPNTPVALPVGTNGQILYANSACSTGLCWGTRPITCLDFDAKGDLLAGFGPDSFGILPVGTNGQVLFACSTTASGLCWDTVPQATPTTFGTVLGCTTSGVAALGCNALGGNAFGALCGHVAIGTCSLYSTTSTSFNNIAIGVCSQALTTSGTSNVAIGFCSLALNTTGSFNVAIGDKALSKNTTTGTNTAVGFNALACFTGTTVSTNDAFGANTLPNFICGDYNVSIGGWSLFSAICGNLNTAVGHRALTRVTCACQNTALGFYAGENITTGCNNVAIGCGATVCSATGNCQLAIGFANGCNWLTGDSNKNIRPGAGITDCAGNVGGAGQILCSTGTAIQWTNNGKMVGGFVNDVGTSGQWIEIDGIQFGMWTGCRSFVMRPASGTLTASWSSCYQGGTVNFGAATYQDIAVASPNWRFLVLNASFPGHGTVQQATICVAASGGFTRAMYQFCGIVGSGYCGNGISVTRITP